MLNEDDDPHGFDAYMSRWQVDYLTAQRHACLREEIQTLGGAIDVQKLALALRRRGFSSVPEQVQADLDFFRLQREVGE